MGTVSIVGAGAVGLVLADAAAEAGHDIVLCGRHALPRMTVIRAGSVRVKTVGVLAEARDASPADLVVFAVKRQDIASAAKQWDALVGPESLVLHARNGIDPQGPGPLGGTVEDVIRRVTPRRRSWPSVMHFGATRLAPGVALRTTGERLVVPAGAAHLRDYFAADAVRVEAVADFRAAQWSKFALNVCAGGLTTLFNEGFGVFRDPFVVIIARAVLTEVRAVAAAEGIVLGEDLVDSVLADLAARPVDGTTSMLRDARAGRPLELEAHSAALVRLAGSLGVAVPVNARLSDALAAPSARRYEAMVA